MTRKTSGDVVGMPPSHPMPLKRTRSATAREAAAAEAASNNGANAAGTPPAMPSMPMSMLNASMPAVLPALDRRSSSTFSISSLMPFERGISAIGGMTLPSYQSTLERPNSIHSPDYMYPADIQPMTFDDKQRLVHRITMLPSQYLRGLIDVIKKYQPDTVRQLDEEYVFDLEQMRENTVYAIQDYVQIAFTELDEYVKSISNATKGGQMGMSMIENYEAPRFPATATKPAPEEPQPKRRHTVTSAAVDSATKQVLQTNGQIKFMEQVEMYSKPKQSKTKTKPSQRHQCETCQKMFRGRSELQNHIRTHTGQKPLVCSFAGCGKRYAHSSNLRAHERSHQGIKPYVCHYDGCGKRFAHSVSLKEHIWMHAGVQPYECPFPGCQKRFTQVSNFARHKKLHGAALPSNNVKEPPKEAQTVDL